MPPPTARTCPICGRQFFPSHHAKKTCSDECRKEYIRVRDKNYRLAVYRKDPDITRRKYRRMLDAAAGSPEAMAGILKKRAETREKTVAARNADPARRAEYLRREQIRNAFRGEYRAQKKIAWKAAMSEQDREKWRAYSRDWKRKQRRERAAKSG